MLPCFDPRPTRAGLTKLVSQMSREGHWAKALELYESLDAVAVRPDTTITNAAISACDKGGQWEKALQIFKWVDTQADALRLLWLPLLPPTDSVLAHLLRAVPLHICCRCCVPASQKVGR